MSPRTWMGLLTLKSPLGLGNYKDLGIHWYRTRVICWSASAAMFGSHSYPLPSLWCRMPGWRGIVCLTFLLWDWKNPVESTQKKRLIFRHAPHWEVSHLALIEVSASFVLIDLEKESGYSVFALAGLWSSQLPPSLTPAVTAWKCFIGGA